MIHSAWMANPRPPSSSAMSSTSRMSPT
jgi:hypothetical protein